MPQPTFKELEHAGWLSRAAAYDDYFGPVTRQAVGPLLDALREDDLAGRDLLDVCTGTGIWRVPLARVAPVSWVSILRTA